MSKLNNVAVAVLAAAALLLGACSGGGGGGGDATPDTNNPNTNNPNTNDPNTNNPSNASAGSFFLPLIRDKDGVALGATLPDIAVDAAGGLHAVFTARESDGSGKRRPAYYAYCASNCDSTAKFSTIALGDGYERAEIQLTAANAPRLLLTRAISIGEFQYQYWTCDRECLQEGNWTGVVPAEGRVKLFSSASQKQRTFALDQQGNPRFVYALDPFGADSPTGTLLASCNADCTQASNWRSTQLTEYQWANAALVINKAGLPRAVYTYTSTGADAVLKYLECSQPDCAGVNNHLLLTFTTESGVYSTNEFSLRLTTKDEPRIAVYAGTGTGGDLGANQAARHAR
jgi:hypothetical protein